MTTELSLMDINAAADVRRWQDKAGRPTGKLPPAPVHRDLAEVQTEMADLDAATATIQTKRTAVEAELRDLREEYGKAALSAGLDDSNVEHRNDLRRQIADGEARLQEFDMASSYAAEQRQAKQVEAIEAAMQTAFDQADADLVEAVAIADQLQQHLNAVGELYGALKARATSAADRPAHHLAMRTVGFMSPVRPPDLDHAILVHLAAVGGPHVKSVSPSETQAPAPLGRLVEGFRGQLATLRARYAGKPVLPD